ncbi:MAG: LysM peptidoglycan-binding domain-containing protein [Candidatus Aminicenantes bacterium]|nr:LysM peptidoglycan-binding domain-containing protein [Candidatus Aminicenantes bacterium]
MSQGAVEEEASIETKEEIKLKENIVSSEETSITQAKTQDPSELLEEALDAYQDARISWDKGDLETALAALDEAYKIILQIDLPQDSPLIQDKNDLRLLIAKRIQEIYASRLTVVNGNNKTIPLTENKFVKEEIKRFQTNERKYFEQSYMRSGLYREMILKEMEKAGLPEQLSWIPLIESGFKVRALSRARALGLWQFISSTGYRFGLKKDQWVDERMDPVKSTKAAIQYLTELHSLFGDWTTALAAYNCGEFKVQKVIRTQRINYLDNFWDLYTMLPRETARFVPRFIAALLIINDPEKYGMNLPQPESSLRHETVIVNRPVKLSTLSESLGLNKDLLEILNPELRHKSTPDREYPLKVPVGHEEKTLAAINSLSRWIPPETTYVIHYVRRGETLSTIAKRYRSSVSSIARLNQLRSLHLIRPGQRLKIPAQGMSYASSSSTLKLVKDGEKLVYIVKRGDSLYWIASAFNTSVKQIKQMNNLKTDILSIGQKLIIQSGKPEGASLYTVKSGDTPYDIAKKFGISLDTLLKLNGLSIRSKIYPGQKLWIKN